MHARTREMSSARLSASGPAAAAAAADPQPAEPAVSCPGEPSGAFLATAGGPRSCRCVYSVWYLAPVLVVPLVDFCRPGAPSSSPYLRFLERRRHDELYVAYVAIIPATVLLVSTTQAAERKPQQCVTVFQIIEWGEVLHQTAPCAQPCLFETSSGGELPLYVVNDTRH